jgi:hypothetical protein
LNTSKTKIFISTPIRNKARILPEFLQAIESLLYPKQNLLCHFFINDSTDRSEEIIRLWAARMQRKFFEIQIKKRDFGTPPDVRGPSTKAYSRTMVFKSLARIRNLAIKDF